MTLTKIAFSGRNETKITENRLVVLLRMYVLVKLCALFYLLIENAIRMAILLRSILCI